MPLDSISNMNKSKINGSGEFTAVKIPPRCMVLVEENRELSENPVEGSPLSNRAVIEIALEQQNAVLTGKKELVEPGQLKAACQEADKGKAVLSYLEKIGIRFKVVGDWESFKPVIDREKLADALGLSTEIPIPPETSRILLRRQFEEAPA